MGNAAILLKLLATLGPTVVQGIQLLQTSNAQGREPTDEEVNALLDQITPAAATFQQHINEARAAGR